MKTPVLAVAVMVCFSGIVSCSSDSSSVVESLDGNTADPVETPDNNIGNNTGNNPDGNAEENNGDQSSQQASDASYRVTFNASWSQSTHPTNFPSGPHFSGLVGAVHSEQAILWEPGQIASDGIEQMAESGAKTLLLQEVQSVIDEGRALSEISGGGVGTSPGVASVEFTVTRDNPQVSIVSMVAPSPDWFVGVHGLSLLDANGEFLSSITIDLPVYDAGTDSGLRYASSDEDTQPRTPVELLSSDAADSNFIDGNPIAGQFVFEKL